MTFESAEDYVYDVGWNSSHPTLFSTVDGEGYIDLWDLCVDIEAPIMRLKTGKLFKLYFQETIH
jgi:dynein intermediate chain